MIWLDILDGIPLRSQVKQWVTRVSPLFNLRLAGIWFEIAFAVHVENIQTPPHFRGELHYLGKSRKERRQTFSFEWLHNFAESA